MSAIKLLGDLILEGPWKLLELKGGIEIWKNTAQEWVVHIIRSTGEVIEQ